MITMAVMLSQLKLIGKSPKRGWTNARLIYPASGKKQALLTPEGGAHLKSLLLSKANPQTEAAAVRGFSTVLSVGFSGSRRDSNCMPS